MVNVDRGRHLNWKPLTETQKKLVEDNFSELYRAGMAMMRTYQNTYSTLESSEKLRDGIVDGILDGAMTYNPEGDSSFLTWARKKINWSLIDCMRVLKKKRNVYDSLDFGWEKDGTVTLGEYFSDPSDRTVVSNNMEYEDACNHILGGLEFKKIFAIDLTLLGYKQIEMSRLLGVPRARVDTWIMAIRRIAKRSPYLNKID
jgi:DNA-directed RNA polymerase specialized sigma24 family protein